MKTDHSEGVYPITNLRFLECHPKSNDKVDQQISPNVQCRPRRQAAEVARARLGQMANWFTLLLNIFFLSPCKFFTDGT